MSRATSNTKGVVYRRPRADLYTMLLILALLALALAIYTMYRETGGLPHKPDVPPPSSETSAAPGPSAALAFSPANPDRGAAPACTARSRS